MFRKLIANASFSPSLISEIGLYAKRLKHEEAIRKLGLITTILALIMQLFSILQPPESANAANINDLIQGGVSSKEEFFSKYERNEQNIRDIFTSLGITPQEIREASQSNVSSQHKGYVVGRTSQLSFAQGEQPYQFEKQAGGSGTVYLSPLQHLNLRSQSKTYSAWVGQSAQVGRFAVILASGNIVLSTSPAKKQSSSCAFSSQLSPSDPLCQPCPSNSAQWIKSHDCQVPILYAKSATNSTKNQLASSVVATPSDRITYTIRAKNIGQTEVKAPFTDQLNDVAEYADVVDTGGGTFDTSTRSLTWPDTTVKPGQTISRSFSVRLKSHIPATPQGQSNPNSYDCIMTNTHTNTIDIDIACPAPKAIELLAIDLPHISTTTNLLAGGGLLATVLYFYFRARQQREELRLIRKDINIGTF